MTDIKYFNKNGTACSNMIMAQHDRIKTGLAADLINTVPTPTFIINEDRKIILYNDSLSEAVGGQEKSMILGKRPGDLLRCCNANNNKCGESIPCMQCGALQAIKTAIGGERSQEECMLLVNVDSSIKAYTFLVNASPITIGSDNFYIIHLSDISDRKHKEMMEKVFLHDLLNAVNGIVNAGTLLQEDLIIKEQSDLAGMIVERARFMANEINAHRLFISAENMQLEVHNEPIAAKPFIESIAAFFNNSQFLKENNISIQTEINNFTLSTDKRILYRIIENLIKNAMEASPANETVLISAEVTGDTALFTISNKGLIPMTVAHQIFRKSFSTKGHGRGLGTYSVKMFTENYLRGKVWFDTSSEDGTNFYVELPISPAKAPLKGNPCQNALEN